MTVPHKSVWYFRTLCLTLSNTLIGQLGPFAMNLGYARTSTTEQHAGLDAQERDLIAAGVKKLWKEQVSSVAQREELKACLDYAREGDTLFVCKPDRLARSTAELLAIEADLTRRGVGLVILSMGGERLDTRNPTSKLMLTILAGVATWEREIMLERQREGIAKAKAEGKYRGRAPTVAKQAEQIRAMISAGEKPTHIARKLKIARSSVYRIVANRGQSTMATTAVAVQSVLLCR
jgi:DNA invertase Pin-like site-specific DNA recombinase